MTEHTPSNRPRNPHSWTVKRDYTNHVDVRSAIVHSQYPIHFEANKLQHLQQEVDE